MSIRLDDSQFNAALRDYMAVSPHTFEEILNRKLWSIIFNAWKNTPVATRAQIEHDLNIIGYKLKRSKKTGKVSRGRSIIGASVLNLMINARRGKQGLKGLYGKEMAKASSKIAGARLRASGTMRRGWTRAMLALSPYAKASVPGEAFGGRLPSGRGSGTPAQPGWNARAEATFEVLIEKGARFDPRVEQALENAFRAEEASMRSYIEEKMNEEIRKISA